MLRLNILARYVLALALILGLAGFYFRTQTQLVGEPAHNQYRVVYQRCWFKMPWRQSIRCGQLLTPQNQGGFSLPFVIIQDDSAEHKTDPLVYLTGGPGASARLNDEGIEAWLHWLEYANLGRDLILMDPRGTGRSTPALVCSAFNRFNRQLFQLNLPLAEELEQSYRVTKHCFENLQQAQPGLSPNMFGTQHSARDIRALIAQLNYPAWNLLGVSYGTRLALEVARQESQEQKQRQAGGLRSLVLDSVYPPGYGGVQTWPQVLDAAFQDFFSACASSSACMKPLASAQKSRPLAELFLAALAQLQQHPQTLTVARWDGEAPVNFLVNDHRLLSASFAAIYHPDEWPQITGAIAAALDVDGDGDGEALLPLIKPYINNSLSSDFNSLAFMLVDCADNPIGSEAQYNQAVARYPLLANYTRDQWRFQICHALPQTKPVATLTLSQPQVPALMLSGALDPITPAAWAQSLKKQWPQLQWLELPRVAHGVLGEDACVLAHLRDFLDSPQAQFNPGCGSPTIATAEQASTTGE